MHLCPDSIRPVGSLINPRSDEFNLRCVKRISTHGHSSLIADSSHPAVQRTFGRVMGLNHFSRIASDQRGPLRVQPKPEHLLGCSVAGKARLLENGQNISFEIDLPE